MAKRGRKPTYNQKIADSILAQFQTGNDLVKCCKDHKLSIDTFYNWIKNNYGNIADDYESSKEAHLESLAHWTKEYILAPLTDEEVKHPYALKKRQLLIKHLQFELERRHKQYYGNSVNVEVNHVIDAAPALERLKRGLVEYKDIKIKAIREAETALECSSAT